MKTIQHPCKFCKRIVYVSVDEEFAVERDPHHLLGLLACNRCADYHTERHRLHNKVKKVCMGIFWIKLSKEKETKTRELLTALVMEYMRLISDHRNLPMPDWDEVIIDDMIQNPGNFSLTLSRVHQVFTQPTLV